MDDQVNRLVEKAWKRYEALEPSERLLIGVAGIPGSGKTTLATRTVHALNARTSATHTTPTVSPPIAALIPMDGYHLTRAQLSAMQDPTEAHARRGAAFTFDAPAYLELVRRLREPITPELGTLWAPTFDHAAKDPVERGVQVGRDVKVCVVEGNYVALEAAAEHKEGEEVPDAAWSEAKGLMDEIWFVEVDEDVARERLARRHVAAGICKDLEAGRRRADENDIVNGRMLTRCRGKVDELVKSREDEKWAPEA